MGVLELRLVAGQRRFRLADLRPVAGHRGLGLAQGLLVGPRIDLEQQLALGDVLALGEVNAEQLAGNLRLDLDYGGGLDGADHAQFEGDRCLFSDGHRHGYRWHACWRARRGLGRLLLAGAQDNGAGQSGHCGGKS